jgi:hypothetical protein
LPSAVCCASREPTRGRKQQCSTKLSVPIQEEKVIQRFSAERNEAYAEFVSRCDDFEAETAKERGVGKFTYAEGEENEEGLWKLRAWLEKITQLDLFRALRRNQAE